MHNALPLRDVETYFLLLLLLFYSVSWCPMHYEEWSTFLRWICLFIFFYFWIFSNASPSLAIIFHAVLWYVCVRVCCWLLRVYTFYVRGSCSVFAFTILSARYMRIYFECTMMMRHVGNFWCTVRVELHFFENKKICYRPPVNIYSMWWSQRAWWSHPNGCEGNSAVCVWEVNGDIIFVFFR